jgi:hypothetical protein
MTRTALIDLESGSVRTLRIFAGRKIRVATLPPPALFGEMGCLGEGRYYYSQFSKSTYIRGIRLRTVTIEPLNPEYSQPILNIFTSYAHA